MENPGNSRCKHLGNVGFSWISWMILMEIFRKIGKTTGFHWILKDMLEKHLDKNVRKLNGFHVGNLKRSERNWSELASKRRDSFNITSDWSTTNDMEPTQTVDDKQMFLFSHDFPLCFPYFPPFFVDQTLHCTAVLKEPTSHRTGSSQVREGSKHCVVLVVYGSNIYI